MFVLTDENGRIIATTNVEEFAEGFDEFDFPEDFDFFNQINYKIVDGELVEDRVEEPTEPQKPDDKTELNTQMQTAVLMFVKSNQKNFTDEEALSISMLFDEWVPDHKYEKDEIIRYEDDLYRIGQDHTSQYQWIPGTTGVDALYSKIEIGDDGYEVWKEWDGVSGVYDEGKVVRDPNDNQLYKSKVPSNVWGPPSQQPTYWEPFTE